MANTRFGWHSGKVICSGISILGAKIDAGTTEKHAVDISVTGSTASGGSVVGLNIVATTSGTAATWAAGLFARITEGATKNVNGYLCAAEFELNVGAGAYNPSDCGVLVLNSWIDNVNYGNISHPAYIHLREYGVSKMTNLLWFGDAVIGTTSKATLLSTSADLAASHTIKILVGATPLWILCNATGP